jgi:succinoglycan biosynthesis transport protein ExoP
VVQTSLNPHINPISEPEAGYGQMFAVMLRRFPWLLLVFLSSTAIAGIVTLKTPPSFKSTMQLLIEPNYQGKQETDNTESQFTDSTVEIDTATQLNLMQSSGLLQKAVNKLKAEYPDFTVANLKSSLVLTQIKTPDDNIATKIFQVDYTDNDSVKTKKVLNTIQEVYLEYNKQQQNSRLQKGLQVIRDQLRKATDEVTASETNLQRFRRNQNLIDPETQARTLETSLNTVQQ